MQRRGQLGQPDLPIGTWEGEREPMALQKPRRVATNLPHQTQRLAVSAKQQMLSVVERASVEFDASGAPAELSGRLEKTDCDAGSGQLNGTGEAGPACTDDGDAAGRCSQPLIHVRQAIHNLRSGVSDVRRSSTRQPSRLISLSSVR